MKKIFYAIVALMLASKTSDAQIALAYDDTLICRGSTITMGASATGQVNGLNTDDYFTDDVINIGFPFTYFGTTYTQCVISGNNFISFNTALAGLGSSWVYNTALNNGQLNKAVMLGFQDLYLPAGGTLKYQTFGTPGSRRFVVEFCQVPKYGGSTCNQHKVTNQVILYEGTNIIEFHTTDLPGTPGCPSTNGTANSVQGIRDVTGTVTQEIFTPGRGPTNMWGTIGSQQSSRRYTPNAPGSAQAYTVDSIAFNPWQIIEQANNSLLQWFDANGNFLSQGPTLTVTVTNPPPPAPGTFYVVQYTGPAGCGNSTTQTFRDTVNVRFSDIKTYVTQYICAGTTYDFFGTTLFNPGVYDTTFLSQIGCDSTIILTLNINPLPNAQITNGINAKVCAGDSYIFRARREVGYQFQWYKDGNAIPNATGDSLIANTPGDYQVEVTSSQNCKRISEIAKLKIAPNPTVKINNVSETDICAMDTITLSAVATGENIEFIWSPDKYFRRTEGSHKASTVKGIIEHSGYVYVKVFNQDLCTATDSVFIKAEPCCQIFIPNAFTPNGDGKNDYFIPVMQIGQTLVTMQVYNRQGEMVFETNSQNTQGWDGKNTKGKESGAGVYMYIIKYNCSDGNIYEDKGDVTLFR